MSDPVQALNAALEGRYRVERELGEGGMATVYLAHDLRHERKVALKVLRPELAAVVGGERFLAEIKTTANLQHPHILPLFDSGEADSFLFYVMPYVEGESLREKLERERQLPVKEALDLTRKVAAALEYAHEQGIVHRDIKPANILVSRGEPLVADFGIALAISSAGGGRITETGLSMGTPHYMSPEQAAGERGLDKRSDIYALGCVLYEMLAGQPPYAGPTAQSVLAQILTGQPRGLTELRASVPLHVAAVVARALEKLPADRFESAGAFREALENESFRHDRVGATTAVGPAPAAVAERSSRAPRLSRLVGFGLAGLAVAALAYTVGRRSAPVPEPPVTRFQVTMPQGVAPLSVCCGPVETLSPDGEWLVFVGGSPDGQFLYRRRQGRLDAEVIPGTEGASIPFFSPDGRWVGFYADGRLRKVPMTGGPPVPIAEEPRVDGASWGDNDLIVFAVQDDSLHTVPAAGGVPTAVASPAEGSYAHPWMLPGGDAALARIDGPGADEDAQVVAVDLETGRADTLAFGTRVAYASGHLLISGADGTLLAQPFDPDARRTTGPAVAILDGVALAGPSIGEFAVSGNGGLAYWVGGRALGEALVIRGSAGEVMVPLPELGNLEDAAFSPDGRRIALRVEGEATGEGHIWIWDRDQQTQELLTVEGEEHHSPVWSPDGSRIAFAREVGGSPPTIYLQPVDGSGPAEAVLESLTPAIPSQFTADGGSLLISARRDGGGDVDIGLLDLEELSVRWLVETSADDFHPQVSPDGRWLAYASNRSGQAEVYVQPMEGAGGRVQVSTGGGHSPRWAPGGDVLYFATGERQPLVTATVATEGGFRVVRRDGTSPGPHDLNDVSVGAPTITWDVSPDGEEFVYITRGDAGPQSQGYVWILNWPAIVRQMQTGAPGG